MSHHSTDAPTGRTRRRRRGGEQPMVPRAEFGSYYGKPILNPPVWAAADVGGYLFFGGLAGASAVIAAGARLTQRPRLARISSAGAAGAGLLSFAALIHDLGRPDRFLNMLRVLKPTSPMSVGTWVLGPFVPLAAVAAASSLTGRFRGLGRLAGTSAAVLGPAVSAYTGALIANTAVPAWHDAHRELPFVFTASSAAAAGGLGLFAPTTESAPARVLAVAGAGCEVLAFEQMRHRMGLTAEPYGTGPAGRLIKTGTALSVAGALGAVLGRRSRLASAASGAALLAASLCTRLGIFRGGVASAEDPKYTVIPQRERLRAAAEEES
ncbi:NrfD/PsrC family molybdoenzyme membrane anchor subunit [Actinocatenispora sera]|uniref:Polysulfide reductase n=1 Tax=Actinocatenispora sera TaxID=390989 RepID=A0A810LBV4_9ACTN|nr:NrfD/PsrC family molybdoenzyme membrane anchor subunit [Actinocatenispora sera]BCJ31736.1 polysulfide reductase [Actinocatenispora sera]